MTNAQMPEDRGWYPDPFQAGELLRMFDGARWTEKTRPIPEDYDAGKARVGSGDSAPKKSAPASPKPPQFTEPAPAPKKEEEKTPTPPAKPHAKNGTAPMFQTPSAKAARAEDVKGGAKQETSAPEPAKKAAPTPPAFATPTAKALREDEAPKKDEPAHPAPPETPTLEPKPKPKFQFSKPAPGVKDTAAAPVPSSPGPAHPKPNFAPKSPAPTPPGPSAPTSVDADFEENSDTVNAAFASVPDTPEYGGEDFEEPETTEKRKLNFRGVSLPSLGGLGETLAQRNVPAWVAAALLAIIAVAAPVMGPDSTKSVQADCLPISKVVASYDGADDFTVTEDAHAGLAAAVSTGQLNADVTDLVTDAVETNDLTAVVDHCLPQE